MQAGDPVLHGTVADRLPPELLDGRPPVGVHRRGEAVLPHRVRVGEGAAVGARMLLFQTWCGPRPCHGLPSIRTRCTCPVRITSRHAAENCGPQGSPWTSSILRPIRSCTDPPFRAAAEEFTRR
nr:hypothetical protein [Pseudonocardia abyssalis]